MLDLFIQKFVAGITVIVMTIGGLFVSPPPLIDPIDPTLERLQKLEKQLEYLREQLKDQEIIFGATKFVAGERYRLAGSGISLSATSVTLQKFQTLDGRELTMSNFGDTGWMTLEPGTSKKEFISFTGISQDGSSDEATLTGVTRGLDYIYPYTASTTLRQSHSGGALAIISNPPQLYNQATFKDNDETITGNWSFSDTVSFTENAHLIDKKYADDLSFSGTADALFSTKGLVELATTSELIAGTATGSSAAYLAIPNLFCNTTSSATNLVPITGTDGKLSQGFLDLTEDYSWSGNATFTAETVFSGTTTLDIVQYNQVYTANATFTVPTGVKYFTVEVVGGGGGGGSIAAAGGLTGGGGGGGYAKEILDLSGTSTVVVTVGAGGAKDSAGGTTSFSSYLSSTGGAAGSNSGPGGAGGTGSNGDINIKGGSGASEADLAGGNGGSSVLGGGGVGGHNEENGGAGGNYGGGGGGCHSASESCDGGAGAGGVVIISWYKTN